MAAPCNWARGEIRCCYINVLIIQIPSSLIRWKDTVWTVWLCCCKTARYYWMKLWESCLNFKRCLSTRSACVLWRHHVGDVCDSCLLSSDIGVRTYSVQREIMVLWSSMKSRRRVIQINSSARWSPSVPLRVYKFEPGRDIEKHSVLIFAARCCASAAYAVVRCPSVCPSGCLSWNE